MYNVNTNSGEAVNEYLYSTKNTVFDSTTIADGSVDEDSDGDRILNRGTVLAKITSGTTDSGKAGPYDTGASDGRQTATNIIGISDQRLNLRRGDDECGYLYQGIVKGAKVYADGTQGSLSATVKNNLDADTVHILIK